VFILEHYLATTSFAAVRKAFSDVYTDKEVIAKNISDVSRVLFMRQLSRKGIQIL
jgi:hypothetical protein